MLYKQGNLTDTTHLKEKVLRPDHDRWEILPGETSNRSYQHGCFEGPNTSENLLHYHIVDEKSQIELLMVLLAHIL